MAAITRDPVCGMEVDPERAVAVEYDGARIYFCETACAETFGDDPERWAREPFTTKD